MDNPRFKNLSLNSFNKKIAIANTHLWSKINNHLFFFRPSLKPRSIQYFHNPLIGISALLIIVAFLTSCTNMAQVSKTRTPGTYIDDLVLDLGVAERKIRKSDEKFKGSHIVVEVFNGNILVVGQVPSEKLKEKAGMELKKLKNIGDTKIHNYLQIAPPTTMLARTNDTFITTKVKTRLFASGLSSKNKRPKYKIKVLTEDGNVYLMGLIDQKDSESITSTVKAVYGVRKIIKLFNELN